MTIADIVVIVILALAGLVGASKGFIKSIMGLIAVVAAALVAWLLGGEVAKLISGISIGEGGTLLDALAGSISQSLAGKGEALTTAPIGGYTVETLTPLLQLAGVPGILIGVIAPPLATALAPHGEVALANVLGPILANITFTAIAFLLVFILVYAIFLLISKKIAKAIRGIGILKGVDVILGLILGAIKAVIAIWAILALLGMLNFVPLFDSIITSSSILTWLVNNNPISLMLTSGLNLQEAVNAIIGG